MENNRQVAMEVLDTASTTSSNKSSSSKTSSNDAAATSSDNSGGVKPTGNSPNLRGHNNMNKDLANAILQRLQDHDTDNPRFPAPPTAAEDPSVTNSNNCQKRGHADQMNSKVSESSSSADGGPSSDSGSGGHYSNGPSSDSGEPSSNSGSGSGSNSSKRSSSSDNSSNVPVWSEEPAVNALAILLILQDLEKNRQENEEQEGEGGQTAAQAQAQALAQAQGGPRNGESSSTPKATSKNLVKTVLKRLGNLEGWNAQNLTNTDLTSLLKQLKSKCASASSASPGDGANMVTADSESPLQERKMPAKEPSNAYTDSQQRKNEQDINSGGDTSENSADNSGDYSSDSASPPVAACAQGKASSPKVSTAKAHRDKKPTKQELLTALQQHLDVLHRRGQVSSVVPLFLRPTNGQLPEEAGEVEQEASSTLAVRKAKRRRKTPTRDDYYEELAAQLLSHSVVPIPKSVDVPEQEKAQQALESQQPQQFTESEDSDLSVSLCSSGSTPNSSDFESSTGDTSVTGTTGTGSTSGRGRSVGFAAEGGTSKGTTTPADVNTKAPTAVSASSGSSGDAQGESSSSTESSGGQQG